MPREIKPSRPAVERHPLTKDQKRQLDEDLRNVEDKLNGIVGLMRAAYGEESQPAIRAEEVWAALQRLRWQLSGEMSINATVLTNQSEENNPR